ncbi:hypothetical protein L3Q82_020185 [Scortum barcoo]|uniref:Uncharacterized protein n=1 Tax=Scortum barcoo TaxID=214431 RepID=A0ACB8VB00_9TELE|nr:hypothetical protein L3Q82_020185 [Scortum barcoo]
MLLVTGCHQCDSLRPSVVYDPCEIDLWQEHFQIITLTEIMRQKDDVAFAKMLNRIRMKEKSVAPVSALIAAVYRPPDYSVSSFLANLGSLLDSLEIMDCHPIIVCGDFNENIFSNAMQADVNPVENLAYKLYASVCPVLKFETVEIQAEGPAPPTEGSFSISSAPAGSAPTSPLLYPDQTPLPPPTMLHLPYEAPPPSTYLSYAPPLPPPPHHHPAHLPHHSSYHPYLPPSTHWGALQTGGHPPRVYCPAPNPAHVVTGGSCIPSAAPDLDWRSTGRTAGGAPAAASHSTKKKKKKKKKCAPAHQTTCSPCEVT